MTNQKEHPLASASRRLRRWFNRLLDNSRDHYFCFLPSPTGTLSASLLERLFSGIFMGKEQADIISHIPDDAIIVYTTKYKSRFEFLFAHTRYRQLRLPVPQLAIDSDIYFWQPMSQGVPHMSGLPGRTDSLPAHQESLPQTTTTGAPC
jgi:glycerol-3-phosphate O-acyltransferase